MLHRNIEVLSIIFKVIDIGVDVFYLDVVRVQRSAGLVRFFASLGVFALAVFHTHFAGLNFPGFVVALFFRGFLGHGMVLTVLLGILLARVFIFDVGLIDIEFSHIDSLLAGIDFHVTGLGMTHFGIEVIDGRLHVHLEVHVIGSHLVGFDLPRFARLFVGCWFLFLGLIAHLGFTALECSVAHVHPIVIQIHRCPVDLSIIDIHIEIHRAIVSLDLTLGTLERGIVHIHFLVKQRPWLHIALDLVGLEQGVAVLVNDLDVGCADIKREFHPHVAHADVHACFFAGIIGRDVSGLVLDPRDIGGKR